MAGKDISVKKYVVRLSVEEREQLQALIRKGKSPAKRHLKARGSSWAPLRCGLPRALGQASRRILGTVVIVGMLAATTIAIFIIPVTFYLVEKLTMRFGKAHTPEITTPTPGPEAGD